MADGKAQITDLNLTQIDANLSDYLSDIRPYEGFVQCNSPWIGGLLNNVYKKKVAGLPEGHKLVKVHNGDIYSLAIEEDGKNGFYKNGNLIQTISAYKIKTKDFDDPYVTFIKENSISVSVGDIQNYIIDFPHDFTFDYLFKDNNFYLTLYSTEINPLQLDNRYQDSIYTIATYIFDLENGNVTIPQRVDDEYINCGIKAKLIFSGKESQKEKQKSLRKFMEYELFDLSNIKHIKIDSAGMIIEYEYEASSQYSASGHVLTYMFCGNSSNEFIEQIALNVCYDSQSEYWARGSAIHTASKFSVLYYNKQYSGISTHNSVVTYDINKILKVYYNTELDYSGEIAYIDSKNRKQVLFFEKENNGFVSFQLINNFIFFDTIEHNNTYNLESGEMLCRSDDYNDRIIPFARGTVVSPVMYASTWGADVFSNNKKNFATPYPQSPLVREPTYYNNYDYIEGRTDIKIRHDLDIYLSSSVGENAKYNITLVYIDPTRPYENIKSINAYLVDTLYPISSENNQLYNISLNQSPKATYINETLIESNEGAYVLAKSQNQETILGYYQFTFTEIDNIFLTQGQFYGINDKYIYSLGLDNSTVSINGVVANKQDLMFLGAFPTMALFWSKLDKSLYSFTGDAILQKVKEAYRINNIYNVYCDPSRLTMIISTDIGVIIIYQNQTMLLEEMKEPIEHIYYDSNTYVLDDTLLSLSEQEDYEPQNIKLHTEYYGVGSGVKSVNDCVYIRIAKGKKNGFIKFQSFVLNDRSTASEEKTVDLPDSVFDPITNSAYIKYQPKNQAGLGFSVKIETTNPVVSMAIGHKPESIANTALKL